MPKYDRFDPVITITGRKGKVFTLPSSRNDGRYGVECEGSEETWQPLLEEQLFNPEGDRFQLIRRYPQGHSFFMDVQMQRVAIADNSGATPALTEDGVLYLDTDSLVSASPEGMFLPLRSLDGSRNYTPCSPGQGLWAAFTFKMRIKDEAGDSYTLVPAKE